MKRSPSPSPPRRRVSSSARQNSRLRRAIKYALSWIPTRSRPPPPRIGIKNVVSAKRVARTALTRRAARKYTHVWNKVMKESEGISPMVTRFGTNKHAQALIYKNRLVNYALSHHKRYSVPLFRGIKGWEYDQFIRYGNPLVVEKINMSSFTKVYSVAKDFATEGKVRGAVLVLNTSQPLPSVDFTSGNFSSVYNEKEVLLPPGYFVKLGSERNYQDGTLVIYVDFISKNSRSSLVRHVQ